MSLIGKAMEQVAKMVPDRQEDGLITTRRAIGQSIDRLDGPVKVSGAAAFAAEHALPRMVHAAIACSTVAKGTVF